MKLELGNIHINDIQFSNESRIEDHTLYVNKSDIENLILEDEHIKEVTVDIAKPGDSTRITPVKDVIEPRVKVSGKGGIFPGVISEDDTVGNGKTNVLKGSAVVTTGKIVGFQEGIIDMSGKGAEYTPFSKTNNLVIACYKADDIKSHTYERAVRMAGLKTASYLGELARDLEPDNVETFETLPLMKSYKEYKNLPS